MRPATATLMMTVLGMALLATGCRRNETTPQPVRRLSEIPPPIPERYVHIQDYSHWKNPYLTVLPNGIGIQCLAVAFTKKVPVGALHQTLLSLPPSAWPYGRVVAVQAGGGPTRLEDSPRIEQNRVQVEAILMAAGVTIEYWPGA